MKQLIKNVSQYVSAFLKEQLSADLHFHNIEHTQEVVVAAKEIGRHCNLSGTEMVIVQTAAWFHDCGYSKIYTGHEEESKKIAATFLTKHHCSKNFIEVVLCCIEATRFPQNPKSVISKVLCDADLYHFTKPDYQRYETAIRSEFALFLGKKYSDEEWHLNNCEMLMSHNYFTDYGKNVLMKFKEVNIKLASCSKNSKKSH